MSFISPSSSPQHKLIIMLFLMAQGTIFFYGVTYLVIPNLITPKRFVLAIVILLILYVMHYLIGFQYYKLVLKYVLYLKNGNAYKYAEMYVQKGPWNIFRPQNIFYEIQTLINVVTLPFLLKLSRAITKYSLMVARLTKEKTDLEIDFLRTQLNPHFLLNSLNNIYSQVVSKDETAADSIVSLSDSMKYILYNSGEPLVDLDSEIYFLKNYVDLQKLRGNSSLKIQFSQKGNMEGYKIAPLILINYLENAFKHVGKANEETHTVDVEIKFENEVLLFKIENDSIEKSTVESKNMGVGLINTKRRLELLYADKHGLEISNDNQLFKVDLWIKLRRE